MEQLLELTVVFFQIGLFSIGGGYAIIPLIREQVVISHAWISQQTFTDIITISQMTPGPLAVNTSTFIGLQIAGIPGAILATASCVISGICISLLLYRFFTRFKESPYIMEILKTLKASSLGLIITAAVTIVMLALTGSETGSPGLHIDLMAAVVFLGALIGLIKWKTNPILIMVISGIIGGIVY